MKTIVRNIILLLMVLMSSLVFSQIQDKINAPFVGVWEYRKDERIFRLVIWENPHPYPDNRYYLHGHYEMAEINGLVQTVLYTSDPEGFVYKNMPVEFWGTVEKGVYQGDFKEFKSDGTGLVGNFKIMQVPYCLGCEPLIHWELNNLSQIDPVTRQPSSSGSFVVPNGVVLEKVK